jgi:uncharacterized membrane protein YqjE
MIENLPANYGWPTVIVVLILAIIVPIWQARQKRKDEKAVQLLSWAKT